MFVDRVDYLTNVRLLNSSQFTQDIDHRLSDTDSYDNGISSEDDDLQFFEQEK